MDHCQGQAAVQDALGRTAKGRTNDMQHTVSSPAWNHCWSRPNSNGQSAASHASASADMVPRHLCTPIPGVIAAKEESSPERCPECLYWRRHNTTTHPDSHCLSCLQFRHGPTDQGAAHPCKLCEMLWLTIQNPVEQRVALLGQQEFSQPDWQPIQSVCVGDARQRPQWRRSSITQAPGHAVADA